MIVFPIRHHSPAGALRLAECIRAARPRLVLIEGPCDATALVPHLLAPDTRPPVAILAYLPAETLAEGEEPRSSAWPFCAYSPEYVALRVGHEVGAELRFFDLPAGAFLRESRPAEPPEGAAPDVWRAVAARFGFEDYEEFWECRFEMLPGDPAEALAELGALVRERGAGADPLNAEREAWMRAEIARALAEGYDPATLLVVCGAAHAPALGEPLPLAPPLGGEGDSPSLAGKGQGLGPKVEARPTKLTLIP